MKMKPVTNVIRIHTGIDKDIKAKIDLISKKTGINKQDLINTALSKGMSSLPRV